MKNNNGPSLLEAFFAIILIFIGILWTIISFKYRNSMLNDGVDSLVVSAIHICGFIIISIGIFLLIYKIRIKEDCKMKLAISN